MKALITLFITVFTLNAVAVSLTFDTLFTDNAYARPYDWIKADHWVCKDNMTWFRYDKANNQLLKSVDNGEKWKISTDGMWNDANGNFLKIADGKVMQTENSKSPWKEVEEWKWKGGDGKWYKFDKEWNLWTM